MSFNLKKLSKQIYLELAVKILKGIKLYKNNKLTIKNNY